jgi:hypothetical protein
MSQANSTLEETIEREIAEARAQLAGLAQQQGVQPVTDPRELQGASAPEDAGCDDIDHLLRLLVEWHEDELRAGGN